MRHRKYIIILLAVMVASFVLFANSYAGSKGHGGHWSYKGKSGPGHWGDLSHDYHACKEGENQSPINIPGTAKTHLKGVLFFYKDTPLRIFNNGHTIQINYGKGSAAKIQGKSYDLLQFHFHSPSEHTVDGKPYDMVAHLVHKNQEGKLAVVAIFFKKGEKNDFIESLWKNLPNHEGKEKVVGNVSINVKSILPTNKSYYNYSGSLTTPPCSEGVNWNVIKASMPISEAQVAKFVSLFELSVRPVQPLNERAL